MEFTLSTKPLKQAVSMSVIGGNITNANPRSMIIELTADKTMLKLNTQSTGIKAEVRLHGTGTDESASFLADINLFKSLINSISAAQVTLCFEENCLKIKAGKTTLSVERDDNWDGMSLATPVVPSTEAIESADNVDVAGWKYVKDHQAYALSKVTKPSPVYTYFFFGEDSDVISGDYVHSLFNTSKNGQLNKNCLVSPFIVNLMATMPSDAKFVIGDVYTVVVKADSYEYYAQLEFVTDEATVSAYPHEVILGLMTGNDANGVTLEIGELNAALNQATLLTSAVEPEIGVEVKTNELRIKDSNVDSTIAAEGEVSEPYSLTFDLTIFKSVINKSPDNKITIYPSVSEGAIVGITIVGDSFTTVLGSKVDDIDVS